MDIIRPTDGQLISQVALGDEEDTRRAIDAAKRAFATYGTSKPEERAEILRRLHRAASARLAPAVSRIIKRNAGATEIHDVQLNFFERPVAVRLFTRPLADFIAQALLGPSSES
jgi:acyl-CoA reductase-like NAD-dependent aldehyde dehydrogenase